MARGSASNGFRPGGRGSSTPPNRSIHSKIPTDAIREALLHPLGDCPPLPELLFPGMRLTIAFDDISLPLPPMQRPDNRQRVIEAVLDAAAAAGVDDVVLICALALHRRMTEAELRHAIGDRVYDAFAPHGLLLQHDAEDPDGLPISARPTRARRWRSTGGPPNPTCWCTSTSTWWPWTVATRASPPAWPAIAACATITTWPPCATPAPLWTRSAPSCTRPTGAWAGLIAASGVKVFQIETTLNNDTFPEQMAFLQRREWEWTPRDRATYLATTKSLSLVPDRMARSIFQTIKAPHAMTGCTPARSRPCTPPPPP